MTMLRRYKVGLNIRYVREITAETTRKDNPLSICQACNDHMIDPKMFCQWRMLLSSLLEQHTKRAANKMHPAVPKPVQVTKVRQPLLETPNNLFAFIAGAPKYNLYASFPENGKQLVARYVCC